MQYDHNSPEILLILVSQLLSLIDLWIERVFNFENGDPKFFPPRTVIGDVKIINFFISLQKN